MSARKAALLLLLAAGVARAEDDRPSRMPRADVERPLTILEDLFAVYGTAGIGQLTGDAAAIGLFSGAEYGIDDDLQIELHLLRLTLSSVPGTGLHDPVGALAYRITRGPIELAGRISSTIPFGDPAELSASLPVLVRIGGLARLDLAPELRATARDGWIFGLASPVSLRFQLGDAVTLGGVAVFAFPDLERDSAFVNAGGRVAYTFGREGRGDAELSLLVLAPAVALHGEEPEEPSLARFFSAVIELRGFIEDTFDSPFGEEL